MSAIYDRVTMDITKDGKSIFNFKTYIASIVIIEELNKIPMVTIALSSRTPKDVLALGDLTLTIEDSQQFNLSYDISIYQLVIENTSLIKLTGFLCKKEDYTEVSSEYLGDNLSDAISTLGFKENTKGIDKLAGNYWRFNETKLDCVLRLIKGLKAGSVAVISNDTIEAIDLSDSTSPNEFIEPSEVENIQYNDRYSDTDSLKKSYDKNDLYMTSWGNRNLVSFDSPEFADNLVQSIKYQFPAETSMKLIYKNAYIDYQIGSYMGLEMEKFQTDPLCIVGKHSIFTPTRSSTTLLLASADTI